MKPLYLLLLIFLQVAFFTPTANAECIVINNLYLGSKGTDVQCLQQKLKLVVDGVFGPTTFQAVKDFQTANILKNDGILGPITRAALNGVVVSSNYKVGCTSLLGYSTTTGARCDGIFSPLTPSPLNKSSDISSNIKKEPKNDKNQNLINMEKFIEIVIKVNKDKGSNETELKQMADALRENIKNSNKDFNKEFENLLIKESKELSMGKNERTLFAFIDRFTTKVFPFLGISPKTAEAAGLPFGGGLVSAFYCSISANWMIWITSLPPNFVTLLSYYPGTQGFASHNIPFTRFLLGSYTPVGVCSMPHSPPVTTQGTIGPITGSSPL